MHIGVTSHLWLKSALHASSHPCMCTCVLRLGCFLLTCLCSLLRPTVLLPALPDVHLSVQREVQVQPPVRLPLGDRGHLRPRDTPHTDFTAYDIPLRHSARRISVWPPDNSHTCRPPMYVTSKSGDTRPVSALHHEAENGNEETQRGIMFCGTRGAWGARQHRDW